MKKLFPIIIAFLVIAIAIFIFVTPEKTTDELAEIVPPEFYEPTYFVGVDVHTPIYFGLTPDDSVPFGNALTGNTVSNNQAQTQQQTTTKPNTLNATPEQNREVFDFSNSLFIGDSITLGLETYAKDTNNENLLKGTYFANAGFAIYHNRQTVNANSMHPSYNGEKMKISKLIRTAKKKDLFISLGTNDLVTNSPSKVKGDFVNLMSAIMSEDPNIKVHIIETVKPTSKGKEKLTVESVKEYNKLIKEYAESKGFEYITWPETMFNEDGSLKEKYCSDGLTHLTADAYKLLVNKIAHIN